MLLFDIINVMLQVLACLYL